VGVTVRGIAVGITVGVAVVGVTVKGFAVGVRVGAVVGAVGVRVGAVVGAEMAQRIRVRAVSVSVLLVYSVYQRFHQPH
jgi:hypothetical protein